ncbi:PD-(D/E)XK motif protein [Pseudomonas aeruginosa]
MISGSTWTIADGWHQLEAVVDIPIRGELRVFDTGLSIADGAVLLAVDAAGLRHVLVPVAPDFHAAHDRRSGGVHLTTRALVDVSGQRQYLDLACQKAHLNNIFSHFAEEVLSVLHIDAQPLQACRQTLQRWRELLDREAFNTLSTEAFMWALRRIVASGPHCIQESPRHLELARTIWCAATTSLRQAVL